MNKVYLAGVAFALAATSGLGFVAQTMAAPLPPPPHDLTFADVKAQADTLWTRLDVNHDGKIDGADRDAHLLERFAAWDTNHDGVISKDEFLAQAHARETAWKEHRHHDPMGMAGHDGPPTPDGDGPDHGAMGHDGPGKWGMMHGGFMAMAVIGPAVHEAGSNNGITRAAFDTAIKARFDKLDLNHDGKLSHDELRAARHGEWGHDRTHPHHDGDGPPPPPSPAGT